MQAELNCAMDDCLRRWMPGPEMEYIMAVPADMYYAPPHHYMMTNGRPRPAGAGFQGRVLWVLGNVARPVTLE
jgi:hypothetical protein